MEIQSLRVVGKLDFLLKIKFKERLLTFCLVNVKIIQTKAEQGGIKCSGYYVNLCRVIFGV